MSEALKGLHGRHEAVEIEKLAERIMLAASNLKDEESGLRIPCPLTISQALQIAVMLENGSPE